MKKKIIKPWGWEEIIQNNKFYTLKKLFMKKNCRCSLQYHNKKIETIYVLNGQLHISIGKSKKSLKKIVLKKGQNITINKKIIHRMCAKKKSCVYLEASTSHLTDVVRIADDFNRV